MVRKINSKLILFYLLLIITLSIFAKSAGLISEIIEIPGGDRIDDSWENKYFGDLRTGDGIDSDGDWIYNYHEYIYNISPLTQDTDNDTISDRDEIFIYYTDPTSNDTDGDGYSDGEEIINGWDPLDISNPNVSLSRNITASDSDGDGMPDSFEDDNGFDKTNFYDSYYDADSDGLTNYHEFLLNTNPNNPDTDNDGFVDGAERTSGTNPNNANSKPVDTDGDRVGFCSSNFLFGECSSGAYNDNSNFLNNYENTYGKNSMTIDSCNDGDWALPFLGSKPEDFLSFVYRINIIDLNRTKENPNVNDSFLRAGDYVNIEVNFICSLGGDAYNIVYKNNNKNNTPWTVIESGRCVSNDYDTYRSMGVTVNVIKKLDDIPGNHTIRAIISHSSDNPSATCGDQFDEPGSSDTDDLLIETEKKLDISPPHISVTALNEGTNNWIDLNESSFEYKDNLIIQLKVNITDETGVDYVNMSLMYNSEISKLNFSRYNNTSIYLVNLSNFTMFKLGLFEFNVYANDSIETNWSTLGTKNHINNYTKLSFYLKNDLNFNITKPKFSQNFNDIFNYSNVSLSFYVKDTNLPYTNVYYLLNEVLFTLNNSFYYETINSTNSFVNNSFTNLTQSFNVNKTINVIEIGLLVKRIGDINLNSTILLINGTNNPDGDILAIGSLSKINDSIFSWNKFILNHTVNIVSGKNYWIRLLSENDSDYLLWGYNNTYLNGYLFENNSIDTGLRIYDANNYDSVLYSSEGLNSLKICENNSLSLLSCTYAQYKIDITPPYYINSSINYLNRVELGGNQIVDITIIDGTSGIDNAYLLFNNTKYSASNLVKKSLSSNLRFTFPITSIGSFNFSIFFNDTVGLKNNTGSYFFNTSDLVAPVPTITRYPTSDADVDPNVPIFFNISLDENSGISDIIFYYKLNTSLTWNTSIVKYISTNKYQANFTPDIEGNYMYSVYANDTFGNGNRTNNFSFKVGYERDWIVYANQILINSTKNIVVDLKDEVFVDNFTIKNNGDLNLSFIISNNSPYQMYFSNNSFTLEKNTSLTIELRVNASDLGGKEERNEHVLISCLDPLCLIKNNSLSYSIMLKPQDAYLVINFKYFDGKGTQDTTTTSSFDLRVNNFNYTTEHKLIAEIKNIGNTSAENVSFSFIFPKDRDWYDNITTPNNLTSKFNLGIEQSTIISVNFTVDSRTTLNKFFNLSGNATIILNGTKKYFSELVKLNITLNQPTVIYLETIKELGGGNPKTETISDPPKIGAGNNGAGGAGAGLGGGLTLTYNISAVYPRNVDLFRGTNKTIQINITNPYKNKYFSSIRIGLFGYYPNYITLAPSVFDKLEFNETKSINITFSAPSYIGYSVNNLRLSFDYFAVSLGQNESSGDRMSVSKDFNLIINEVSREDSIKCLEETSKVISNATNLNYSTTLLKEKFERQKTAVFSLDFTLSSKLCKEIKDDFDNIVEYSKKISDMENKILESINLGYSLSDTQKLLNLSKQQFSSGQYDLLENSFKDVETSYALTINLEDSNIRKRLYKFVTNNFKEIIFALIVLSVVSYFVYRKVLKEMFKTKIRNLELEKIEIGKSLLDLQNKYYVEKSVSPDYFNLHTDRNKERIAKINQELLHNKSASLKFENKAKNEDALSNKELKIKAILSDLQKQYYVDHAIDKKSFDNMIDSYNEELSDTKKAMLLLKHKPKSRFSLFKGKVASLFYRK